MKKIIKNILRRFNYELLKIKFDNQQLSYEYLNLNRVDKLKTNKYIEKRPELTENDLKVIRYVFQNELTMVSPARLTDTILAVKHVNKIKVPGSFVECGTWRGGNSIAASLVSADQLTKREFYIYDTFTGMSEPDNKVDKTTFLKESSTTLFNKNQKPDFNSWCYASLDEVKQNFHTAGLSLENINFIQGKVEETLIQESNLPEKISILRLDTDWYESTMIELEILYPKLRKWRNHPY